jgi:hypothetical protein
MAFSEHALQESSDVASDATEVEHSDRVPLDDAIAAQSVLCKTLSMLGTTHAADGGYLHALLALDRQAKSVEKSLLSAYVDGHAPSRPLDSRYLISARLLSRSFVHAYERLLDGLKESAGDTPRKVAAAVLVQLFRHRRVEFLLRSLRYKKRNSEQWRQLHRVYRFAQDRQLERETPRGVAQHESGERATLQQQFIEILLMGLLNTGQFSPREQVWATVWISRWSSLLALQPLQAEGARHPDHGGFIVQLDGADGLLRMEPNEPADLHLDTGPLVAAIDDEIAAIDAAPADGNAQAWARPGGGIALLTKLRIAFSPHPVHIARRGERTFLASSVDALSGFKPIVQVVRDEARNAVSAAPASDAQASGTTLWFRGPQTIVPLTPPSESVSMASLRTPKAWQVKDWSDSGCRLRGRTGNLNDVIPGTLMSIREHHAEWIIAIVRRLRRLMVDHVEISLEFIGRGPRFVKLVQSSHRGAASADVAHIGRKRFGALYLPVSERSPTMPVKSLIVPVAAFKPGQTMKLASSTVTYALRFNKPFEEHADYVWTTFTLIEKLEPKHAAPARAH